MAYGMTNILKLVIGLYGFILALTGFKTAWTLAFSAESSAGIVNDILNASLATPFTGLMSGVIITSLIQSSSATIALVVTTVAAGAISVEDSVFILMGANIGTTITNTIVGLAQAHKRERFDRMVPAIIVDDVFKFLNVLLFYIIEVTTGFLHGLSVSFVNSIQEISFVRDTLGGFPDVLDALTDPAAEPFLNLITSTSLTVGLQALAVGLAFFTLLIVSLGLISDSLEHILRSGSQELVDRVLNGKVTTFLVGFAICWGLQSSSVAVSLILPLVAHSAVGLPTVYYYSIGAALGTTCDPTQLLSYLKFGPVGLTAGMVHVLLNLFGAFLFLFLPGLNRLPIWLASRLAGYINAQQHAPALLIVYVASIFFGLPLLVIGLTSSLGWAG